MIPPVDKNLQTRLVQEMLEKAATEGDRQRELYNDDDYMTREEVALVDLLRLIANQNGNQNGIQNDNQITEEAKRE